MRVPTPRDSFPGSVLVTGGAGFVGARVVRGLLAAGSRVVVADDLSCGDASRLPLGHSRLTLHPLDVEAPRGLLALCGEEGPFDVVLHLAARVGVRRVLADPEGCRSAHRAAARELVAALQSLPAASRPRLVAASTSEVYRECAQPLTESHPLRSRDAGGRWAYAASKLEMEATLDAASDLWPADRGPVHLRLFNVVGPGQDAEGGMVLPTFVRCALAGAPLPVHGDGEQVRTLAHVDDLAADVVEVLLRPDFPAGPLNLGGTARCTVNELAHEVLTAAGGGRLRSVDPRHTLSARFEEVRHREPCLDRARDLGLAGRARSLADIVRDSLEYHRRFHPAPLEAPHH